MDEISQNGKTYIGLTKLSSRTGYNREYLRKIAKSGKVDALQIGSEWLINPEDLDRYKIGRSNRGPHKES